jgi:hypothetical protein
MNPLLQITIVIVALAALWMIVAVGLLIKMSACFPENLD